MIVRSRLVAREEWEVCIPGHHPGYIDWETYLSKPAAHGRQRARARWAKRAARRVRAGRCLGLVRVRRCGRQDAGRLLGSGARSASTYACTRAAHETGSSELCQRIGGRRVDQIVLDAVFAALEPATLRATAGALAHAEAEHQQHLRAFEAAVERARYEAERARRQFDAVEPENRLVASGLEASGRRAWPRSQRAERGAGGATQSPACVTDRRGGGLA